MKAIAGAFVVEADGVGIPAAGVSVGVTGNATSAGSTNCGTSRESFFSGTAGFDSTGEDAASAPDWGHA